MAALARRRAHSAVCSPPAVQAAKKVASERAAASSTPPSNGPVVAPQTFAAALVEEVATATEAAVTAGADESLLTAALDSVETLAEVAEVEKVTATVDVIVRCLLKGFDGQALQCVSAGKGYFTEAKADLVRQIQVACPPLTLASPLPPRSRATTRPRGLRSRSHAFPRFASGWI